jgi:hypothetical protein
VEVLHALVVGFLDFVGSGHLFAEVEILDGRDEGAVSWLHVGLGLGESFVGWVVNTEEGVDEVDNWGLDGGWAGKSLGLGFLAAEFASGFPALEPPTHSSVEVVWADVLVHDLERDGHVLEAGRDLGELLGDDAHVISLGDLHNELWDRASFELDLGGS